MKVKEVIDEFGKKVKIDESSKKLYKYNNEKQLITYNAQIIENGVPTGFWTNYDEAGTVEDVEERLKAWNNQILLVYSLAIGFNARENDPQKERYQKLVKFVKEHEKEIFTKKRRFQTGFINY